MFDLTQDRDALLERLHPVQIRALRDYLIANYGSLYGDSRSAEGGEKANRVN
jgi:hypothetical protein